MKVKAAESPMSASMRMRSAVTSRSAAAFSSGLSAAPTFPPVLTLSTGGIIDLATLDAAFIPAAQEGSAASPPASAGFPPGMPVLRASGRGRGRIIQGGQIC